MLNVYFISGLGTDHRAFGSLPLPDFVRPIYAEWLPPLSKQESLPHYASRMIAAYIHNDPLPVIVGLSFGGIMAIEIAKQIKTKRVIIISSIKHCEELQPLYKWAGKAGIHRWVARLNYKNPSFLTYFVFGANSPAQKRRLRGLLNATGLDFVEWAAHQAAHWQSRDKIPNLVHIHGENDRIFPVRYLKNVDYIVPNASHLLIGTHGKEVGAILADIFLACCGAEEH